MNLLGANGVSMRRCPGSVNNANGNFCSMGFGGFSPWHREFILGNSAALSESVIDWLSWKKLCQSPHQAGELGIVEAETGVGAAQEGYHASSGMGFLPVSFAASSLVQVACIFIFWQCHSPFFCDMGTWLTLIMLSRVNNRAW